MDFDFRLYVNRWGRANIFDICNDYIFHVQPFAV